MLMMKRNACTEAIKFSTWCRRKELQYTFQDAEQVKIQFTHQHFVHKLYSWLPDVIQYNAHNDFFLHTTFSIEIKWVVYASFAPETNWICMESSCDPLFFSFHVIFTKYWYLYSTGKKCKYAKKVTYIQTVLPTFKR